MSHLFLVSVAHREVGDVLLAVEVGSGRESDAAQNSGLKRHVALLSEVVLSGYGAANWHRILLQKQVVLPRFFVWELHPRADRVEVVHYHSYSFPVSYDVVVTGHKVKADVILLTEKYRKFQLKIKIIIYTG